MKSLKKALAVLLSVLMVAFSFPLTSFALPNPKNTDGIYADDYDIVIHAYVMDYDGKNSYGYTSNAYGEEGKLRTHDLHNLKKDELASEDGVFALVFTMEGVDKAIGYSLTFEYANDPGVDLTPAYYSSNTAVKTGKQAAAKAILANAETYDTEATFFNASTALGETGEWTNTLRLSETANPGLNLPTTSTLMDEDNEDSAVPGLLFAVVGFKMCTDELDLSKALNLVLDDGVSYVTTVAGNDNKLVVPLGAVDTATLQPTDKTCFTMPEWGLEPASEDVTYTYTYADGSKTTVTAAAGETPEAPKNSDPTYKSDGNGHHTEVTYSWPTFVEGTTSYTEKGTESTTATDCTMEKTADAVTPTASTPGKTAVEKCTKCGYTTGGETTYLYTYKYADGETTATVTAVAGEAPEAPENTAVAYVSDGKGNHTPKNYKWPAFKEGTYVYEETYENGTTVSCKDTLVEKEKAVAPTHTADGKTAVMECSVCGYTTGGEAVPKDATAHTWVKTGETASTCKTQGTISYKCECGETKTEYKALDSTNHENVVDDAAVKATCNATGLTAGSHCTACGATVVAQQEIPVDKTNHVGTITTGVNAKEATRGEDGYTGDSVCSACGDVVVKGQGIPATGVMITVNASDKGTSTLNGTATTGAAQKVAYEKEYTLTATPAANAKFVGWQVNGKLVSTESTYTTAAYADLTYTPVFAADEAKAFNVTFVDQFSNVIAKLSNEEVAALGAMPTPYEYKGFTFKGWSMDLDAVKALTGAATVVASYEKDTAVTYTVTAPTGCTITVDGKDMGTNATVSHDAKVTVSAANEGTWKINGKDAAFGSEYTFFVTANVNVEFVEGAVTAQPVVTAVAADKLASNKARFLATRSVPEDYNLLESGFVFGKDVADTSALVLENVGNGAYIYKNSNTAADGQFALTLKTSAASVSARAYIIVEKDGVSQVIYAEPQTATLA